MTLAEVQSRLRNVKPAGDGSVAACPAHDDKRQSLSIGQGKDGKILLNCHAGCEFERIVGALGLDAKDLFNDSQPRSSAPPQIVAQYDYTDDAGTLLYQVVRKEGKQFTQRRPDGKGAWEYRLNGTPRVLYRLPELIEDIALGRTVYVCEGEKDANALRNLGLAATTNSGGAGKWLPTYADSLAGADVIVLPDNDGPGREHATLVVESLKGKAKSARILELPGLPEKGDVSDWLASGGTAEKLRELIHTEAPTAPRSTRFQLLDINELSALPEITWLVDKAIPERATVAVVGPTKQYKSFLTLDLLAHVSLGLSWQDRPTRSGPVVFIAGEGAGGIQKRLNAWRQYYQAEPEIFVLPHSLDFGTSTDVLQLIEGIRSRIPSGAVAIIAIDTFNRCMIGDENSSEYVARFMASCDALREAFGATILVVHHSGHGTGGDTGKRPRPRGSSAFEAAMDAQFICTKTNGGDRVEFYCDKLKDGIDGWSVEFEVLQYAKSLVLKASGVSSHRLTGQRLQALLALHRLGADGATSTEWQEASEIEGDSSFQKARKWLKDGGYVVLKSKRYFVSEPGKMSIQSHCSTTSTVTPPLLHSDQSQLLHSPGGIYTPGVEVDRVEQVDLKASGWAA